MKRVFCCFFVFLIFIVKGFNIIPTMTKISKDTNYKRNCPNCTDVLYYNNTSSLNLAERKNKVCRSCAKLGTKTKKNHVRLKRRLATSKKPMPPPSILFMNFVI